MMELTIDNYHSLEANRQWMSSHQWARWLQCPAKQAAILRGEHVEPPKATFVLGQYFDRALLTPDELPKWWGDNALLLAEVGLVTKKGNMAAELERAENAVCQVQTDGGFMAALQGEKQVILVATMFGLDWRCALDVYDRPDTITDLKTTASFADGWYSTDTIFHALGRREGLHEQYGKRLCGPFWEQYGYYRQLAIYRAIAEYNTGIKPACRIAAIRKLAATVDRVNCQVVELDPVGMDWELQKIAMLAPRVIAWKTGNEEPPRCEADECGWCLATRPATEVRKVRRSEAYMI